MAVFWVVAAMALMMEAARTSETQVNFYQTARRYNPEDSHLRIHRRENLKFYNTVISQIISDPNSKRRMFNTGLNLCVI
jgi:hypothetical protein